MNQLDLSDEDIDTALWARDEGNYPRVQNHQMPLDGPITYCGHTINGGPSFDNHVNLDVGTFDSGCVLRVCHQDKDCELFASESTLQNKPNKMIAPLNIQERVKTFLETREEYINKLRNDELAATTSTSRNSSISSSISSLNMTIPFSHPPLPPTPIEIIQRKKSKELTLDDLIFAVRQNNPDLIHKIAISGFNLNSKDSNEMYPVQIAILEGRNEALKALADAGADLSVQNPAKTQTLQQLALSIDQDKKGMIGIINNTNSMRRDLDEIYKQLSPYISKLNNMSYYYDTLKNPSKTENSEAAILKQLKEQLVPIYSSITNSKLAISEKAEKMKDIGAIVENAETEINKIPRSFTSQIKGLGKASSHAPNVLRTVVHELKQDLGLKLLIEDLDKINKPATLLKPNPASSNAGNI